MSYDGRFGSAGGSLMPVSSSGVECPSERAKSGSLPPPKQDHPDEEDDEELLGSQTVVTSPASQGAATRGAIT